MELDTIPSRLQQRARDRPDAPGYYERRSGRWVAHSFAEYAGDMRRVGRALLALGFAPGDNVAILGFNAPEWVLLNLGAMAVGGAAAGIYTTSSTPEIRYIAGHCEARVLLIDSLEQWQRLAPILDELPRLLRVVTMPGCAAIDHDKVVSWETFLGLGDAVDGRRVDERIAGLAPQQPALLIYTSGTTGPPKGVMLSHDNLAWTAALTGRIFVVQPDDCSLSYLPLSHIAEQMFTIHGPITNGYPVYFAESLAALPQNLKEVQPTIFFGVPRIWEKLHGAIAAQIEKATPLKRAILEWARGVGTRVGELRQQGRGPTGLLAARYFLARVLVFDKLKPAVGLGRLRMAVSGAAPINLEVLEFFRGLDVLVQEVYGQSEVTGPTTFNLPGAVRLGTVGQAVPGVEVRLADDGEICVRGHNVFLGYFKDPEATAQTLVDGWLHSGDLGQFDAQGFLSITGRKKEIIITAGGKNIAPKNIEAALKRLPLVEEAVVIGDRRRYLTSLLTLNVEVARQVAGVADLDAGRLAEHPRIVDALTRHLDALNQEFARVEQVKHFRVLPRSFSVETGELTPTLKIKRQQVNEIWAAQIESMYAESSDAASAG
jgi:long-chain acyl-CoA synthetase